MKKTSPGGDTPVAQGSGANNEGPGLSGLQLEMIIGTSKRVPSKGGRVPTAACEDPEAPDTLTNMLRQASVSEGTPYLDGYDCLEGSVRKERIA